MNRLIASVFICFLLSLLFPLPAFGHPLKVGATQGTSSQPADPVQQDEDTPDDAAGEPDGAADPEGDQDATEQDVEEEGVTDQNGDSGRVLERVTKETCDLAFGYETLDSMAQQLLQEAKREAIQEIYGEVFQISTIVENFVLSEDTIRSDSTGIIRIDGSPKPVNGQNVGEVCLTIEAYTRQEDRARFELTQLSGKGCHSGPNVSLQNLKETARREALRDALERYDAALNQLDWADFSHLPKEIEWITEETNTDINSFCTTVEFRVIPIEVQLLLSNPPPPPTDYVDYVLVAAGAFWMGSDENKDESPEHSVELDAFRISRTPVTNEQYAECVNAFACTAPANPERHSDPAYRDHPVTGVTWEQATSYAQWAGGRLPTEAEWEKTCRGSFNLAYPWGYEPPDPRWVNFNRHVGDTTPVDAYPSGASSYGALDMAGNVWEWIGDWYDADYYADAPQKNPTGPESGTTRVLRGGSYRTDADTLRCADRFSLDPTQKSNNIGFRIVLPEGAGMNTE